MTKQISKIMISILIRIILTITAIVAINNLVKTIRIILMRITIIFVKVIVIVIRI